MIDVSQRAPGPGSVGPHVWFIGAALAFALFGGFALAITLPLDAALRTVGTPWLAHAQVHGHVQVVGFAGLFVVGMALHLLPRFSGRFLVAPTLVAPTFVLLTGGVLLRLIGQPLAAHPPFATFLALGAIAEALGAVCFAVNVIGTVRTIVFRGDVFAPFFAVGAAWFAVQAALGMVWLIALAWRTGTVLEPARDAVLLRMQVYGVLMPFLLGVGLRAFPTFFAARRPGRRTALTVWAALQVGLVLASTMDVIRAISGDGPRGLAAVGDAITGTAIGSGALLTGYWRGASRLRDTSRTFALALRQAMGWLTIAAVLLIVLGVRAAVRGDAIGTGDADAMRHIVAVGVVTMTIVAMAQLILPEFASERFSGRQGAWRGVLLGVALSVATALRAGARLLAPVLPGASMYWAMAAAGIIAYVVLATFAVLFVRAARSHRALLSRFPITLTRT